MFKKKFDIIFVISGLIASFWRVFIKFRWHGQKLSPLPLCCCWMMPYFISLYCSMMEIKLDVLSLRFQMQWNWCIIHWIWKEKCNTSLFIRFVLQYCNISMTSLLTHTVAHSTKLSFRPKTNNQPILSLSVSWVKVVKNCKILTFKSTSKMLRIFLKTFTLKNIILEARFLLLTFLDNFNF